MFRMILGDGLWLTSVGVLVGLAGVVSLTRFLSSLLFDINPLDPATLTSVIFLLLMVSAVACYIPALRATNADPASILREE
jgi:ABC-type antimicrobial peptide transport system permease subunit